MSSSKSSTKWVGAVGIVALIAAGFFTQSRWLPPIQQWASDAGFIAAADTPEDHHGHSHGVGSHSHGHSSHASTSSHADDSHHDHPHEDSSSLELSLQAMRNVGLTQDQIQPIKLGDYRKSITVPAVVVERPGRTRVQVATPMTGVITQVLAVQGEAIEPGTLLFKIRLTHEDLVQAQTACLLYTSPSPRDKRQSRMPSSA